MGKADNLADANNSFNFSQDVAFCKGKTNGFIQIQSNNTKEKKTALNKFDNTVILKLYTPRSSISLCCNPLFRLQRAFQWYLKWIKLPVD